MSKQHGKEDDHHAPESAVHRWRKLTPAQKKACELRAVKNLSRL